MGLQYLVSTVMGDSLLPSGTQTYVQITREGYLIKSVEDLKPGDLVVYAKPFTTTDLEDVIPFLERSPRYAKARDTLHTVNKHGEYIPNLRVFLSQGLAATGVIDREDLESKILFEDNRDFLPIEYKVMERYLHNILTVDGQPTMSPTGIRHWLDGSVVAPRNWSLFETLAKEVHPAFSEFNYADEDPNSFYFNYRLYVTIRQGVMKFLNRARGTTADDWKKAESKISLSPEYQIIFNHFIRDMNLDYAAARVTGVTRIQKQREKDYLKGKTDKGVVKKSPELRLPEKSYSELLEDLIVLDSYLLIAIEDFDCGPINNSKDSITLTQFQRYYLATYTGPALSEHFGEDLDPQMAYIKSLMKESRSTVPFLEPFVHAVLNGFLSGEMDSFFSFERGTMMNLLEAHFRTRTAMPNRVYRYLAETEYSPAKGAPILRRKERKGRERERYIIKEKYDLELDENGHFFSKRIFLSNVIESLIEDKTSTSPRMWLEDMYKASRIKEIQSNLNSDLFLRTKSYTLAILKRYGLKDIVDLAKEEFYLEKF